MARHFKDDKQNYPVKTEILRIFWKLPKDNLISKTFIDNSMSDKMTLVFRPVLFKVCHLAPHRGIYNIKSRKITRERIGKGFENLDTM